MATMHGGRFQDKLVTMLGASNAASMGAATARRFAREGARLVHAARNKDNLTGVASELRPLGIRVNSIASGFTRSEMTAGYFAIPTLEAAFKREIPLGRLGTVEDIANAALSLASDETALTTGQVIDVTSGQSLRRTPTNEEIMG
jgi:NAD(P)-dependent dehydrogenase (short-subunit alcohol dehydrogenase family)